MIFPIGKLFSRLALSRHGGGSFGPVVASHHSKLAIFSSINTTSDILGLSSGNTAKHLIVIPEPGSRKLEHGPLTKNGNQELLSMPPNLWLNP